MYIFELRHLLLVFVAIIGAIWALAMLLEKRGCSEMKRQMYRQLYEHLPLGILLVDDKQTYVYANLVARRLLQLRDAPSPLPVSEPWALAMLQSQAAADGVSSTAQILGLPAGQILNWRAIAIPENLRLVILQDITRLTQLKRTTGHLLDELSHELRTPVSVIATHLHILDQPNMTEPVKAESLKLAQKETQHMQQLVHDMLELGRLEARDTLDKRALDLNDVVSQTLDEIAEQATQKQIGINVEIDSHLPLVEGNEVWLKRVYLNLIDNAVKHGRSGDQINVEITSADDGVRSIICDTGSGIPAKHVPLVIERFHRVKRHGQLGSGLGLTLVSVILQRHDSHLEIESRHEDEQDESGVCVSFPLPIRTPYRHEDASVG